MLFWTVEWGSSTNSATRRILVLECMLEALSSSTWNTTFWIPSMETGFLPLLKQTLFKFVSSNLIIIIRRFLTMKKDPLKIPVFMTATVWRKEIFEILFFCLLPFFLKIYFFFSYHLKLLKTNDWWNFQSSEEIKRNFLKGIRHTVEIFENPSKCFVKSVKNLEDSSSRIRVLRNCVYTWRWIS